MELLLKVSPIYSKSLGVRLEGEITTMKSITKLVILLTDMTTTPKL